MPIFSQSFQRLLQDSINDLMINTNITKFSPGGKARAILEAVNKRLAESYDLFDVQLAKAYISSANGQYLDLIASLLGTTRIPAQAARADSDLKIIKFYVDTGTFGDINNNQDIVIPVGTLIGTSPNANGSNYRVIEEVVLNKTTSSAFVSAEAIVPGNDFNVGSNSLIYHNFNDYSDYLNNTLKITNIAQITTGSSLESDANFRFRIVNRILEAEAANETAIRLAILSSPGVADVVLIPQYRGIGTFGAIIQSTTPTVSQTLLDRVTANVLKVQGYGSIAYIRAPFETGITLKTSIHYRRRLTNEEYASIESQIINTIETYVNNLNIGEELIIGTLVNSIFGISSEIANIGDTNNPIEELYIWKESKIQDNRIREKYLGTIYTPENDERVIMEPTVSNRIVLDRKFIRR